MDREKERAFISILKERKDDVENGRASKKLKERKREERSLKLRQ